MIINYKLVGNTYPSSLVERKVICCPISIQSALYILSDEFESYWGHDNTIPYVKNYIGIDVTPKIKRNSIRLNADGYPLFNNELYKIVIVISPRYQSGYRPNENEAASIDKITEWNCIAYLFYDSFIDFVNDLIEKDWFDKEIKYNYCAIADFIITVFYKEIIEMGYNVPDYSKDDNVDLQKFIIKIFEDLM